MTADRHALLDQFVAAWHARDLDAVAAMFAPDFCYEAASFRMASAEAMVAMARAIWIGTPDEHVELITVTVEGDRLAAEVRTTATHRGDLTIGDVTLPATGRRLDIMSVWVMTFAGDRIARWNEYGSIKQWAEQMGATVTIVPAERG
ncbi:nuclear transport factor 2 family protein [Sphingomonas bacterium]|uniref:nuclear transport factor 2 family protein n=1 Tax=Sphingomonas bacterium TaxID=1895847 RepID=UPI001576C820|nr:nuclear transport factor 2 family protein [Sphingomonas bacterium]